MSQMVTTLKLLEGYSFDVKFDLDEIPGLVVDEVKPTGNSSGPNPLRLLSTAIGHCLSSSLLFCLNKARVKVNDLETTVTASTFRNEENRLRVKDIQVQLRLDVDEEERSRLNRCLEVFENYCTVTQSVRNGLDVKVNVS